MFLLPNLLHFGRVLHALGLDVHSGRMLDVASALEHVDVGRRSDFYFTLQSLLIHRQQDLATFDEAFRVFWRPPPGEWSIQDLRALGEQRRFGSPQVDVPAAQSGSPDDPSVPVPTETIERIVPTSYSAQDVSRVKDFAQFTEDELRQGQSMIAALTWNLDTRQTCRWTGGRGRVLDLRTLVRRNGRYGGELMVLPTRERLTQRRPLVLIADVS